MRRYPKALLEVVKESLGLAGLGPDDLVVIGLSGGVDSLTLTHALVLLRDAGQGPIIHAVHVDHALRLQSADDAREVERLGRALGVPVDVARVDVAFWDGGRGRGIEAAAREARYAALARIARDHGTPWIVLGHTLDDQVETVIFRLARGTSLDGLAGMRRTLTRTVAVSPTGEPSARVRLLRPWLHVRRAEIEAYAARHRLVPVEDESNTDIRFRRNAIRHQVLPLLERIIPGAFESVSRAVDLLADDADLLNELADDAYQRYSEPIGGCIALSRDAARGLPVSLQRRLITKAVFALASGIDLTAERIEAVRAAVLSGSVSTTIEIGGSLAAYVDYEHLVIGPATEIEPTLRAHARRPSIHVDDVIRPKGDGQFDLGSRWELVVCSGEALEGWELRTRRPGDRVALDSARSERLQDWFVDHKVPSYLRDEVPLLVRGGTVRWILGFSTPDFEDVDSGLTARLRERSMEVHGNGEHDSGRPAS